MNDIAKEKNLDNFRAEVGDCRKGISGDFDLILSTYMLHHLSKEEAEKFILEAKDHTKLGGLNIITTFTKEGDFYKEGDLKDKFYPALGKMKDFYEDWEVIKYIEENRKVKKNRKDGSLMFNITTKIIARKIKS